MAGKPLRKRLEEAGVGSFFRPRDLRPLGISFQALKNYVAGGEAEKAGHGQYRLAASESSEFETVAMASSAIPGGIVCLLTALRVHEIGTQAPYEVWLAIDRKARKPSRPPTKVRIVRFSGPMLTYGVTERRMMGVPVKITSPARTVVDCFRYRNKLGVNVALEALRDSLRLGKTTVDEIVRAAEMCRARTVMQPYLAALSL